MPISKVEYYSNDVLVGTKTSTPFNTFTLTNAEPGPITLTAKIYIDGVLSHTSPPISVEVVDSAAQLPDWFLVGDYGQQYITNFDDVLNNTFDVTQLGSDVVSVNCSITDSVIAPNGKIYSVGYRQFASVGGFFVTDPTTNELTRLFTAKVENFKGIALGLDGYVYTSNTDVIYKIDPTTDTIVEELVNSTAPFKKMFVGNDGIIYLFNGDSNLGMTFNPSTSTFSSAYNLPFGIDDVKLLHNGDALMYGLNGNNVPVLSEFNIASATTYPDNYTQLEYNFKLNSDMVLATNGNVYFIQNGTTNGYVYKINVTTKVVTNTNLLVHSAGGSRYFSGALGPDGKLYFVDRVGGPIIIVDTSTETFTTSGNITNNGSLILAKNGKLMVLPFTGNLKTIGVGGLTLPDNLLLSRYYQNN